MAMTKRETMTKTNILIGSTCVMVATNTWGFSADGEDPVVNFLLYFCLHCIPDQSYLTITVTKKS